MIRGIRYYLHCAYGFSKAAQIRHSQLRTVWCQRSDLPITMVACLTEYDIDNNSHPILWQLTKCDIRLFTP